MLKAFSSQSDLVQCQYVKKSAASVSECSELGVDALSTLRAGLEALRQGELGKQWALLLRAAPAAGLDGGQEDGGRGPVAVMNTGCRPWETTPAPTRPFFGSSDTIAAPLHTLAYARGLPTCCINLTRLAPIRTRSIGMLQRHVSSTSKRDYPSTRRINGPRFAWLPMCFSLCFRLREYMFRFTNYYWRA